ncbi:hypothetical protein GCM10009663_74210 [Kitasatospora arboriphila]|uniref:Secreted protein n=1 Tax=Kitasatospora arboriphila TaxID=258052 RepID=A0ABN1U644_9ACTN
MVGSAVFSTAVVFSLAAAALVVVVFLAAAGEVVEAAVVRFAVARLRAGAAVAVLPAVSEPADQQRVETELRELEVAAGGDARA